MFGGDCKQYFEGHLRPYRDQEENVRITLLRHSLHSWDNYSQDFCLARNLTVNKVFMSPKILLTLKIKIEIEINSKENQFLKIQNTAPYHGVNHNCKARDLWRTFLINCAQTSSVTTSAWKPCFLVHFSHVFVEHRAAKLKPEPTTSSPLKTLQDGL